MAQRVAVVMWGDGTAEGATVAAREEVVGMAAAAAAEELPVVVT